MSKVAIEGNASGTGTLTIAAPNTNSNFTLTIPDATTTLVGTDATQTLTNKSIVATQLTGTVAAARLPAGSVLQVVSTVFSSNASTSSSSFTGSGMSASITPASASNKIFIIVAIAGSQTTTNGAAIFTIFRGASNIGNASDGLQYAYTNATFTNPFRVSVNMSFLDSPNTTSSTTYEVRFKTNTVGTVAINEQPTDSTITLMEIAA